jgi:3-hydroxyisobutyrate dehydrogenase-like beta-hydroxyacid dehydrogenase
MGGPMAVNLRRAGFSLAVHDRRRQAAEEALNAGADWGAEPAIVAARSDVVLTSLPSPEALRDVVLGNHGVLAGAASNLALVLTDTLTPAVVRDLGAAAEGRGVSVLDAPVSGGPAAARNGTLTVMVGGDRATFAAVKPVLDAIGKHVHHVGPLGSASGTKLVNNLLSLGGVALICEGMLLGAKAGLNLKLLHEVVAQSTGRSYNLEVKLPQIARRDFASRFSLNLAVKDLGLILAFAKDVGAPLLLGGLLQQVYQAAQARGLGDLDHTAVVRFWEELGGAEVRF